MTTKAPDTRTIQLDDATQLAEVYANLEKTLGDVDFREAFDQRVFPKIEEQESKYFASESAPDGTRWPKLAPATIKRKGHDVILVDTGRLKASLTGQTGDSVRDAMERGASFGTSVPYAGFHQSGTKHLPQRAHVGVNEELLNTIATIIGDAVIEQIRGF